jgi:hypothetical protein
MSQPSQLGLHMHVLAVQFDVEFGELSHAAQPGPEGRSKGGGLLTQPK